MLLTEGARVKIANKDRYSSANDWSKVEAIKLPIDSFAEQLRVYAIELSE